MYPLEEILLISTQILQVLVHPRKTLDAKVPSLERLNKSRNLLLKTLRIENAQTQSERLANEARAALVTYLGDLHKKKLALLR